MHKMLFCIQAISFIRKSIWPITRYNQIQFYEKSRYNELFHLTEKTLSVFTTIQKVV